jgi:hypothetical protein
VFLVDPSNLTRIVNSDSDMAIRTANNKKAIKVLNLSEKFLIKSAFISDNSLIQTGKYSYFSLFRLNHGDICEGDWWLGYYIKIKFIPGNH